MTQPHRLDRDCPDSDPAADLAQYWESLTLKRGSHRDSPDHDVRDIAVGFDPRVGGAHD